MVAFPNTRSRLPRFRTPLRRPFARLLRSENGAAAVEFAIIITPFMLSVFSFIELGFVLLAQEELQTATTQASRLVMTGIAKNQSLTVAQLEQQVCAHLDPTFVCANIFVNVQTFTTFSSISRINPLKNGAVNTASLSYSIGNPGDIVLMQVFYQLPVITAVLGTSLTNMNGNYRLIQATAVFRNEPY